jgi:hypothetical protein
MLITRQDIVILKNLAVVTDLVPVDAIPDNFKQEFQLFFFGKTLVKRGNKSFAFPHDIKRWVAFLINKYQA